MNNLTAKLITLLFTLPLLALQVAAFQGKSRIRQIDFSSFTYPQFEGKTPVRLKGGKLVFESEGCHTEYSLKGIEYVDFTDDGKEEALVHVEDFTACGSSGVSDYYYVYTMRNNRPHLLWRFATGSEGLAGLKDFKIEGRELVFELFGQQRISGTKPKAAGDNSGGECCPRHYTRIRVAWDGRRFRQKNMQTLPFPYQSITDYYLAIGFPRK